LGIIIGMRTWQSRWRQQKVQQYDERRLQQHDTFGLGIDTPREDTRRDRERHHPGGLESRT
jgi:hypothetical protein